MTPKLSAQILIALSIVYGFTCAFIAVFAPSIIPAFAVAGGLVVGLLWVLRGVMMMGRRREP